MLLLALVQLLHEGELALRVVQLDGSAFRGVALRLQLLAGALDFLLQLGSVAQQALILALLLLHLKLQVLELSRRGPLPLLRREGGLERAQLARQSYESFAFLGLTQRGLEHRCRHQFFVFTRLAPRKICMLVQMLAFDGE